MDKKLEREHIAAICLDIDRYGNVVKRKTDPIGSPEFYVKGDIAKYTRYHYVLVFPGKRPKIEASGYFRMYVPLMDKIIEHDLSHCFKRREKEFASCIAAYLTLRANRKVRRNGKNLPNALTQTGRT